MSASMASVGQPSGVAMLPWPFSALARLQPRLRIGRAVIWLLEPALRERERPHVRATHSRLRQLASAVSDLSRKSDRVTARPFRVKL